MLVNLGDDGEHRGRATTGALPAASATRSASSAPAPPRSPPPAITQLFTGGELDETLSEDKTLLFNDSVQDAAHRAGFVASRSYTFSLRALLNQPCREDEPIALNDLMADLIAATHRREEAASGRAARPARPARRRRLLAGRAAAGTGRPGS